MSFSKKIRHKQMLYGCQESWENYDSGEFSSFRKAGRQAHDALSYRFYKFTIGTLLGLAYFIHVSNLFEATTKFSHLSNLERELTLPPDVAFRYSFYKRIGESDTFLHGLASILHDKEGTAAGNICPNTKSINPFAKSSLSPEVVHGATFHLLKAIEKWTNNKFSTCHSIFVGKADGKTFSKAKSGPRSSKQQPEISTTKQNTIENWENGEQIEGESLSCLGFGNLFYFYINSIWVIESFMIILLFYFGCKLSKSILGGGVTVVLFIILHPQRTASEWIFSFENRIEWAAFLIQIFTISNSVLKRSHPPWTATVKVGLSTALLILCSEKNAQWLLISQLIIITCMEFLGLVNPYIASLVIFGQLTGWQYATMLSLPISFTHSFIFLSTLASCALAIHFLQPTLDWILGSNDSRFIFVRSTLLFIGLQIILFAVSVNGSALLGWSGMGIGILEDVNRFPFFVKSWQNKSNFEQQQPQMGILNQVEPASSTNNNVIKVSGVVSNDSAEFAFLSTILHHTCNYPTFTYSWDAFLYKYVFHVLTGIYVVVVTLLLPSVYCRKILDVDSDSGKSRSRTAKYHNGAELVDQRLNSFSNSDDLSTLHSSSSSTTKLEPAFFFIKQNDPRIIFNGLVLLSFLLSCMHLGRTWELHFISHLCLFCSLVCDQKRIETVFGRFNSKKHMFENRVLLHWLVLATIFLVLFANSKRSSNEMHQNSRAKFEIGNKRIQRFTESVEWIQENTDIHDSCFIGLEIPLLYVHSFSGRCCLFQNHHYNHLLDDRFDSKFNETTSFAMANVYAMFSRTVSIQEYYKRLKLFNATHLFLSRESCSESGFNAPVPILVSSSTEHKSKEHKSVHVKRSCDLSDLWAFNEKSRYHSTPAASESIPTGKVKTSKRKFSKDIPIKDKETVELSPEVDDILCLRLLNERDVRPFKRVFENNDYAILTFSKGDKSEKSNSKKKRKVVKT